ncbi:Protein of unknown function [Thermosyntropha lipolytica DSM 11003]|uniref:DUF2508 domain-containing protein n=1 Tax=Thermosyntropha lipolytica DSM 11003 TaxID=1123382 RepID=A0A1M5RA45_9FIRM|nr:DUF2508 family protein [Thermosyntropha lipolytica]SHH23038.1 Protein of unknown function [Thermosyntropha lipolytica DSM 11003]
MPWFGCLKNLVAKCFCLKSDITCRLPSDLEMLEDAKTELYQAHNILSHIEEPDMLDWAIFNLRAAEEKYNFILRRIKRRGKGID